ncbi:MAG: biotin--[acetyl-CoA-carboxylase] ligase [Geminicoccaceae bacterium]|nr:biotin--[acetyl-CoA-carboxylase] ligase [Geminicoccaceae bacterium]
MSLPHPFRLETFGEVTSTNDIIQARAVDGEAEGLVVTATAQTAGRGRRGRSWSSPAGNLYCSFLLRPRPLKNDHPGTLSLVVALSLAEAIGDPARLKWPNDVLIGGAKVAGILLEMLDDSLTVGMGVNIVHAPGHTPYPVTSLAAEGIDRRCDALLAQFLDCFARNYASWNREGFSVLRDRWLDRAEGIGSTVRLRHGERIHEGRFLALSADGSISIEHEGRIEQYSAGELLWHKTDA